MGMVVVENHIIHYCKLLHIGYHVGQRLFDFGINMYCCHDVGYVYTCCKYITAICNDLRVVQYVGNSDLLLPENICCCLQTCHTHSNGGA